MSGELYILVFSVVLGFIHIIAASHAQSLQRGYRWTASARDEVQRPLTGLAGRLTRASANFLETFPLFAAAIVAVELAGLNSSITLWGAGLYFAARLLYLALYAAGVWLVRSLVWNVAALGIFMILFGLISN